MAKTNPIARMLETRSFSFFYIRRYCKDCIRSNEKLREAKQEQEEKWDKNILEYQQIHGTSRSKKDMKKRIKQSYNKDKREIPTFLSDDQRNEVAEIINEQFAKFLEKKDKKRTIN